MMGPADYSSPLEDRSQRVKATSPHKKKKAASIVPGEARAGVFLFFSGPNGH